MQLATFIPALALAIGVSAHGRPQGNIRGTGPFENQRISANACQSGSNLAGAPVIRTLQAGSVATHTWNMEAHDGAGPIGVAFDTTGRGTNFRAARVTKNMDGLDGGISPRVPLGPFPISFRVPNTPAKGVIMQMKQNLKTQNGWGGCIKVDIV
jgi:hypothetical protein